MDFLRKLFGRLNSQPSVPPPAETTHLVPSTPLAGLTHTAPSAPSGQSSSPPGQATRTSPIERPRQPAPVARKHHSTLDLNSVYPSGTIIAERYEVVQGPREKPSLAGGMGLVYLCNDRQDDRPVALKTFQSQYLSDRHIRDLFLKEGTTWVNLGKHPHIVRAYKAEFIDIRRDVYLALELVAGAEGKDDATLRSWLTPGHPLPLEQTLLFALHIARGMKHATTTIPNLTHRDLKPENVLVGRDGQARVTDFGLASTQPEGGGGTDLYKAPEQKPGERQDARADIYALGLMVYEMVTGISTDALWQARKDRQLMELPGEFPAEVRALVRHCLAPEREQRYGGWEEVEAAITETYQKVTGKDAPGEITGEAQTRAERVQAGWSYSALGSSYLDMGKVEVAVEYFERMVQVGRVEAERELEGAALGNLGLAYYALGDARRAIEFYEQDLAIAREIGNRRGEGSTLGNLGNAYAALGDARRAIEYHEQHLAIAREIGDRSGEGKALGNLGISYQMLGDARRAIEFFEQHLAIAREIGDRSGEGKALGNLGNASRNLGDTHRAIEFYEQALAIAREVGNRNREGAELGNLGGAYMDLSDLHRAIEFFEPALAVAREVGDRQNESRWLGNLGVAYKNLGDVRRAIELHEQRLTITREIGDRRGEGIALGNLGVAYKTLGDTRRAIEFLEQRLTIARDIGDQRGAGAALINLGAAYADLDDADRAFEFYKQALENVQETGDKRAEGNVLFNMSLTMDSLGDRPQAIRHAQSALKIYEQIGSPNAEQVRKQLAKWRG